MLAQGVALFTKARRHVGASSPISCQIPSIRGYPNVKAYASAPGSRNVISSVLSRTLSCSRTSW